VRRSVTVSPDRQLVTKCHDSASRLPKTAGEPSGAGRAEPAPERLGVDEVGEHPLTVDLDGRDLLPVPGLELGIVADVDDIELEAELGTDRRDDLERTLAQRAVRGGVEPDDPYG
jgi:hypothetical protein